MAIGGREPAVDLTDHFRREGIAARRGPLVHPANGFDVRQHELRTGLVLVVGSCFGEGPVSRHIDDLDLARRDRLGAQQLLGDRVDAHSVRVVLGLAAASCASITICTASASSEKDRSASWTGTYALICAARRARFGTPVSASVEGSHDSCDHRKVSKPFASTSIRNDRSDSFRTYPRAQPSLQESSGPYGRGLGKERPDVYGSAALTCWSARSRVRPPHQGRIGTVRHKPQA